MNKHMTKRNIRIAALGALAGVSLNVSPVSATTLSRSADVNGTVSAFGDQGWHGNLCRSADGTQRS
jgi:hypothetical protein